MASGTYHEIIDFLVKSENIESALDLYEIMPRALDRLQLKFWRTLEQAVDQGLRKRGVTDWVPQLLADDAPTVEPEDLLKARSGCLELRWSGSDDKMPVEWAYWLEQDYRAEKGLAPLKCGLGFYSGNEQRMKR
jgi:hypothetical protein